MTKVRSSFASMLVRPRLVLALVLAGLLSACGMTAPKKSEGFAELESLGVYDVDRTINLSIGPTLLRFAARHIDGDPEIVELLRGLEGVRIRIYEIDGAAERVVSRMQRMGSHLRADGWEPIVLLREKNEQVQMLMKMHNGAICGLTFLTTDGEEEAVVINLMGAIGPEQFSNVVLALDINAPGVLDVEIADSTN